ncbi:MAG TPA: nuclear transport factor 2 family protein [Solirubrobacter sp.]|nr:nuclear transport factor 2 family protein [Solirubrobacter sp.]
MLYERWLLELWHGDYAVADEILAPDFVGRWPDREVAGRDALVDLIRDTRAMFSSLEFRLELGPIAAGDLVAARWTGVGRTDEGEMPLLGHDILRVADGRFTHYWVASWAGTSTS